MPRSMPMTFDMHDPFERRFHRAGPNDGTRPLSLAGSLRRRADPALHGYIGAGFFACKQARRGAAGIFGRECADDRRQRLRDPQGLARPAGAGGHGRRARAPSPRPRPSSRPLTPWGKPMSVRMTSAGRYGWFTDRSGYRYVDRHPSGVALAADPAVGPRRLARARLADARPRLLPRQPLRRDRPHGPAPRRRRDRTSPGRCSRSASATARVFRMGGAGAQGPDLDRSCSRAATSSSSAARPASPTTASTASAPAPRACCRRADGSTSRSGWSSGDIHRASRRSRPLDTCR